MSFKEEVARRGIRVEISYHQAILRGYAEEIKLVVFVLDSDVEKTRGYNAKTTLFITCPRHSVIRDRIRITQEYLEEKGIAHEVQLRAHRIRLI